MPSMSGMPTRNHVAAARKPMATARRVSLYEREIRVHLGTAAIEILFASAEVLSEGQRHGARYFGSTMIGIDRSLIEAASSMGSTFRQTFLRIYLPLSLPGIYAGCLLVFILAMGFYITPALLGSPQETTISVYIQQQIQQLNWGEGTAMAVILVAIVVGLFTIYDRLLGFDRLFRDVGAR